MSKHRETCRLTQPKLESPKNEDNEPARGNPLSDLPEWLQEFRKNLVKESVPEHRDAPASSSREPVRKEVQGKQCLYSLPERPELRDARGPKVQGPFG